MSETGPPRAICPYALDIWSLGALVHKLLTNEIPFLDRDTGEESESNDFTGLQPTNASDFLDINSLIIYCHGKEFPVDSFLRSPLSPLPGAVDINFVKALLVPDPTSRPIATRAWQDSWLTGYTSPVVETLKEEFSSLGVNLESGDAGERDIMRRQMGVENIFRFVLSVTRRQSISLLCEAIVRGYSQTMDRLLVSVDLTLLDSQVRGTILKAAIETGAVDMLKSPLRHRLNIGAYIGDELLLQWASRSGYISVINLLLTNELYFMNLIQSAVESNDLRLIHELEKNGIDLNQSDHRGQTALHMAVAGGQIDLVVHLLSTSNVAANPRNRRYVSVPDSQKPLQTAVLSGHIDMVKLLLENGADINVPPAELRGFTALQAACKKGSNRAC